MNNSKRLILFNMQDFALSADLVLKVICDNQRPWGSFKTGARFEDTDRLSRSCQKSGRVEACRRPADNENLPVFPVVPVVGLSSLPLFISPNCVKVSLKPF